MLLSEARIFL